MYVGVIPGLESTLSRVDLFFGRVLRDLDRNNSEIASQNRAVTMNAVPYFPTLKTMLIESLNIHVQYFDIMSTSQ